jgi:hypothetical protein
LEPLGHAFDLAAARVEDDGLRALGGKGRDRPPNSLGTTALLNISTCTYIMTTSEHDVLGCRISGVAFASANEEGRDER